MILGEEGFIIRSTVVDGRPVTVIAGGTIWQWQDLPGEVSPRYRDYARALGEIGINGAVINNVNATTHFIESGNLPKVAALADVLRAYGIRLYSSIRYNSPMVMGGLEKSDPLGQANWYGSGRLAWNPTLDAQRHADVLSRLREQSQLAELWRDTCIEYFSKLSGIPEHGVDELAGEVAVRSSVSAGTHPGRKGRPVGGVTAESQDIHAQPHSSYQSDKPGRAGP